jgi:hypothetical protein
VVKFGPVTPVVYEDGAARSGASCDQWSFIIAALGSNNPWNLARSPTLTSHTKSTFFHRDISAVTLRFSSLCASLVEGISEGLHNQLSEPLASSASCKSTPKVATQGTTRLDHGLYYRLRTCYASPKISIC